MTRTTCAQCGQPLAEKAKFCGQCGAVTEPDAPARSARTVMQGPPFAEVPSGPAAAPSGISKGTMMGLAVPSTVARGGPLPIGAPGPPPAPPNAAKQTMMGLSAPGPAPQMQTMMGLSPLAAGAAPAPPTPVAPAVAPLGASNPHKTMLGLASPALGAPPPVNPDGSGRAAPGHPAMHRTMLGVAMPGIAPTGENVAPPPGGAAAPASLPLAPPALGPRAGTLALNVPYVPPPAPLRDLPAPPAPRIAKPARGVPLGLVALAGAALVLVVGVTLALVWRGARPISAVPHSTADG